MKGWMTLAALGVAGCSGLGSALTTTYLVTAPTPNIWGSSVSSRSTSANSLSAASLPEPTEPLARFDEDERLIIRFERCSVALPDQAIQMEAFVRALALRRLPGTAAETLQERARLVRVGAPAPSSNDCRDSRLLWKVYQESYPEAFRPQDQEARLAAIQPNASRDTAGASRKAFAPTGKPVDGTLPEYIRADEDGMTAGMALSCNRLTPGDVQYLKQHVAEALHKQEPAADLSRLLIRFDDGVARARNISVGPTDYNCTLYNQAARSIATAYGAKLRSKP